MADEGGGAPAENAETRIHASLICATSKLFWRTHTTFAIHIFQHEASDVLEVITYNTGTDDPAQTIFLSVQAIFPMVEEEIRYKYNTKLHSMERIREKSRIGHTNPKNQFDRANALILHEITVECISEYIVHHMVTEKDENGDALLIKLQAVVGDGEQAVRALSALEAPPMPSDAFYQRQIKPTVEDAHKFEKTVSHVATETSQISKLSDSAAQMEVAARKSVNQKRWRKAIRKVIQHLAKEKQPPERKKAHRVKRVQAPSVFPGSSPTEAFRPLQNYVEPKSGQPIENNVFLYHHKASAVRIQTCDPPEVEVGGEPTPPPEKPPLVKKQPQTPQIAATNNLLRPTIGYTAKVKETSVLPSITKVKSTPLK